MKQEQGVQEAEHGMERKGKRKERKERRFIDTDTETERLRDGVGATSIRFVIGWVFRGRGKARRWQAI